MRKRTRNQRFRGSVSGGYRYRPVTFAMRSLKGLKVIVLRACSTAQATPVIAAKHPFKVELKADKKYPWCSCGYSKKQPFCDGSHKKAAPGLSPLRFTITEDKEAWLCGCKQTKNPPYCDGTHKESYVQNCTLKPNQ
ncbi:CDGSH iron-sulfur domain-containing protein 3, mitochondrial [Hyla sarda]|uniref:CDGSH iron-sulfur domain-containing protein 3, mitochondrial n=1 Tax=Hyla sarda TaxID=327740 RepID=UPI0024C33EE3|nr:CDGSH iron-sulfur domain-containing protein 3, mitochondrial [Hyla sarda]